MKRILLKSGYIYDGKGKQPFIGDILIEGDKIINIGANMEMSGDVQIMDVSGLAVTPGFIDMHRHCDKSPFEVQDKIDHYGNVILRQGITTVATGNCGISMYPLSPVKKVAEEMQAYYAPVLGKIHKYSEIRSYDDYIEKLKKCSLPVNTTAMIGLGAIRIALKGFSAEPFTQEEIEQCQYVIDEAIKQGAPGVSIGLMYLPECYETAEELGEILKPVGQYGKIVTAHIRGEGDSLVKSVEEVIRIGKLAGCRMEISHFKSCGMANWNREIFKAIKLIDAAKTEGQEIDCDFYPYDCGSTTLLSMIPPEFSGGDLSKSLKKLRTKEGRNLLRTALKKTYENWDNYAVSLGWDKVVLSAADQRENQGKIGKSIVEITKEFGYEDEVEAVADLLVSENGGAAIIIQSMDQLDIDTIATLPYSCLISDAIYAETDRPHPRMYGAFPRMIRDYVKERHVLSMETAVQKMTSIPAARLGLDKRGCIEPGYYADINVFDPERFRDMATYAEPTQYAQGLTYCFVNGKLAVREDEVLAKSCGTVLLTTNKR